MSRHLSSEEICEWVSGERDSEVEQHARGCSHCRDELDSLSLAISRFRRSARHWADQQSGRDAGTIYLIERAAYRITLRAICWAGIAIVICILAGLSKRQKEPNAELQKGEADGALLRQIDVEVSQTIPESMRPLTTLMSWDSNVVTAKAHHSERHVRIKKPRAAA